MKNMRILLTGLVLYVTTGMIAHAQRTNDLVRWGKNGNTFVQDDITELVSGRFQKIAIKEDGSLVVWGGLYGDNSIPSNLTNAKSVSIGSEHSAAIKTDSTVVVWGWDYTNDLTVPSDLSGVVAIASGNSHILALKSNGELVAWGSNYLGQSTIPEGLTDVKSIFAADDFSAAVKLDGTVVFWGATNSGQTSTPEGLSNVKQLSVGSSHALALLEDGTVVEWGSDRSENCTIVTGLTNVRSVFTNGNFSAAIKEDGNVVAWSRYCEAITLPETFTAVKKIVATEYLFALLALKEDGTIAVWNPSDINHDIFGELGIPLEQTSIKQVAAGRHHVMVLKKDGSIVSWGNNMDGGITVPTGLSNIKAISMKSNFVVALKEDATIAVWGDEYNFMAPGIRDVPTSITNIKAVSAGEQNALALRENGTVVSWKNGVEINYPGVTNVKAIAAGNSYNLVLKEDGTVANLAPNPIPVLTNIKTISVGNSHALALKEDGTVVAWGNTYNDSLNLVPIGLSNVKAISASGSHNLALKEDGTVVQWGGHISQSVPAGLADVAAISAGHYHSVALLGGGDLVPPISWKNVTSPCSKTTFSQDIRTSIDLPANVIAANFDINYDASVLDPTFKTLGKAATPYGKITFTKPQPGKVRVLLHLNQAPQGITLLADELLFSINWKRLVPQADTIIEVSMSNITLSYPIGYGEFSPDDAQFNIRKEYQIEIKTRNSKLMPLYEEQEDVYIPVAKTTIEAMGSNCTDVKESIYPNEIGRATIVSTEVNYLKITRDIAGDQNTQSPEGECAVVNSVINTADVNRIIDIVRGSYNATPLELLSADVNLDGAVTLADASLISSRSINEYGCEFPQIHNYNVDGTPKENYTPSRDWLFVAKSLADQYNFTPTTVPQVAECQELPTACLSTYARYHAILLGDVTGNWNATIGVGTGLRTTSSNQLLLDFVQVDTLEHGYLIPVILNAENFIYGIDMTINLAALPEIDAIVPVEGVSTRWNKNSSRLLLQTYEYDGLTAGEIVFYLQVSTIPGTAILSATSSYINGEASTLRLISENSLDSDNLAELQLYPNPATKNIRINWHTYLNETVTIELYDVTGRLIQTNNKNLANALWSDIDVSTLNEGTYLFRITSSAGTTVKSFVKE